MLFNSMRTKSFRSPPLAVVSSSVIPAVAICHFLLQSSGFLDFRDDARDLYRMVLVRLRTGLFTGHVFRILVIFVANIFPNLLTWGEISHLLYFPGPRKGSGVFVGSLKFEVT